MVPIIIGFLASLVGLGGIGAKIRSIIETLQKPVNKALDFVIKTGLKLAGPIIRGIKGISGKVKAKVAAGKAYVKGKVEAGKQWAKEKVEAGRARAKKALTGEKAGPEERARALDLAMAAGQALLQEPKATLPSIRTRLAALKRQHGVRQLDVVVDSNSATEETVHLVGSNSPTRRGSPVTRRRKGGKIDKAGIAEEIARRFRARVDSDISRDVDRAFAEFEGPASAPAFPVTRRAPSSTAKKQAREEFGNLRGDSVDDESGSEGSGYAGELGVAKGGQVHHAIELQVLGLYPGVFSIEELNDLDNMRGITPEGVPPGEVDKVSAAVRAEMERKKQLHNSKIREVWNRKYNELDAQIAQRKLRKGSAEYKTHVRQFLVDARNEIDYLYGPFFSEFRQTLEWRLGMLEGDAASMPSSNGRA
jgi:hypothetical protein